MPYKGKSTTRSWADLPPDLLRLIVTFFLLDFSATSYLPQSWASREHWLPRMAYTVVRDTDAIEQLMSVHPAWSAAIEYHLYWQKAITVLDPHDMLLSFHRSPQKLSPYKHLRLNILSRCCVPCRVNQPTTSAGLFTVKRQVLTYALGSVPCCKDHRKDRLCGICLRDSTNEENAIAENEDTEYWPQIESTCRHCRVELLWRVCNDREPHPDTGYPLEVEAIGGRGFVAADWETRQAVDAFVEMGEGTIREVINLAMEKLWLRKNTKMADMMNLAMATSRQQSRHSSGGYGSLGFGGDLYENEEDLSELEAEEEEEDPELMSITEEAGGVRDLAINDWARTRILEGHWISPADQWFQQEHQDPPFPYFPAKHPCPWNISMEDAGQPHPSQSLVLSSVPPSAGLCTAAFEAFKRQLRALLLPAMTNIVRRIVMECAADGTDACVRTTRMNVEDVAEALRDGDCWLNGIDWRSRRELEIDERDRRVREESQIEKKEDTDNSSTSSKSGSEATSPVLSTSTLQTTPSPPPMADGKKILATDDMSRSCDEPKAAMAPPKIIPPQHLNPSSPLTLPIAISPILDSPTQIPSIPFIPMDISGLPHYTLETFKDIWREAIAPLYQCRCTICERAVMRANIEAGWLIPSQTPFGMRDELMTDCTESTPQSDVPSLLDLPRPQVVHSEVAEDDDSLYRDSEQPEVESPVRPTLTRKRSCDAVASESDVDSEEVVCDEDDDYRGSTPPKRPRLDENPLSDVVVSPNSGLIRLEKRRSEELDDSQDGDDSSHLSIESCSSKGLKRARVGLTSPLPPPASESESLSENEATAQMETDASEMPTVTPPSPHMHLVPTFTKEKIVPEVDLDDENLYVLDDVNVDLDVDEMSSV